MLAGIGFTMSLFMTELAFTKGPVVELATDAKRGILGGSLIAACGGALVFTSAGERAPGRRTDPGVSGGLIRHPVRAQR